MVFSNKLGVRWPNMKSASLPGNKSVAITDDHGRCGTGQICGIGVDVVRENNKVR